MSVPRGVWTLMLAGGPLLAMGCDRGEPGRLPPETSAIDVRVSLPMAEAGVTAVPGTVRSTREAEVATRMSGTVRRVEVDVGDRVAAGAALVLLDDADVRAAVRRAEAEAERARAYHRRIASLAGDGAATAQELDDAVAGLEAAEAQLEAARGQLEYVAIRAPFAGVVTARGVDPGDLAVPGMPVVALVNPGSVEIEADVPSELALELEPGLEVTVRADDGRTIPASVRRISPAVDRHSRRARVKLDLTGGASALPAPGSFVRVEFPRGAGDAVQVPEDAIVRRGQLTGLFLVEDGVVRLRWVRVGERSAPAETGSGARVEILAGLASDALVVRRPDPRLVDGAPVGRVERVPAAGTGG